MSDPGTHYKIDGRDVVVCTGPVSNYIVMDGFNYLHFDGEITQQRVEDMVRAFVYGEAYGNGLGREHLALEMRRLLKIT